MPPPRLITLRALLVALAMCLLTEPALAQHSFQRTLTVDPSGNADFTKIQGAIDSLADDPTDKWTIFIYSGVYDEAVTLDGTQENIDLVGVDRDAVIVVPTIGNGITITSGTETSRNNTIRNLTIRTTDGHGVAIVKGGTPVPKDIIIEDCVVEADGTDKEGITGTDAENTIIRSCDVVSSDSTGVPVGDRWTVDLSSILSANDTNSSVFGLRCNSKDNLVLTRSRITSIANPAIMFNGTSSDCHIMYCHFESHGVGGPARATVRLTGLIDSVFSWCSIVNDATIRSSGAVDGFAHGVFVGTTGGVTRVLVEHCDVRVAGSEDTLEAVGVKHDTLRRLTLRDCTVRVSNLEDPEDPSARAWAFGIQPNGTINTEGILVIGGSVETSSTRERETEVYDLSPEDIAGGIQLMSGTRLSKWRSPVLSGERPRSVIQRVLDVAPGAATTIRGATSLTGSEQEVTPTNQPDVYRVVSVKGSTAVMDQTVFVIGTNFAGDRICDAIDLNGTIEVSGVKPFKSIDKIILPANTGPGQTVSVGVTDELGLQLPISDAAGVIQIGRKASAATSYTIETLGNFTIGVDFATVTPNTITSGDSFEFVVLSSQ